MLHACLVSTLLCFVYILTCFYIFSGTNLLTSCHSASCLFSSVFGSRKAENQYSRNWMGQKQKSIFYRGRHKVQRGDGEMNQGHHTPPRHAWPLPRAWVGCGPSGRLPSLPPAPIRSPWESPKSSIILPKKP